MAENTLRDVLILGLVGAGLVYYLWIRKPPVPPVAAVEISEFTITAA